MEQFIYGVFIEIPTGFGVFGKSWQMVVMPMNVGETCVFVICYARINVH